MDAFVGYAAFGVIAAGAAGFLLSRDWLTRQKRRRAGELLASEGASPLGSRLAWRLRHGVAPFLPAAAALLRWPAAARAASATVGFLGARGVTATPAALASTALAAGALATATGWAVAGSPVFGLALVGCSLVGALGAVRADADKRQAALRDEVPDALRSLGVCFRAGLSLEQTLRQTGTEMKGPLGRLFISASHVLETGGGAGEALEVFRRRADVPELAFVAVALDVQHACGGSIAPVLDAARESVESEIDLARSLRVQTAQAKLSARIVTVMPFVLVALFSLMSPRFLAPFFESVSGAALLAVALAMQAAGVLMVHRMLDVEVG